MGGIILVFYLLADGVASVSASAREGWAHVVVLPWLFLAAHVV